MGRKADILYEPGESRLVRHIHLAFRHGTPTGRMDPEEIYAILTGILLSVANTYDPDSVVKCGRLIQLIHSQFLKSTFDASELNLSLDFDSHRHCRLLSRRGFLEVRASQTPPETASTHLSPDYLSQGPGSASIVLIGPVCPHYPSPLE